MKRAIVIGSPGAGKSTFASKLRDNTGLSLYYPDRIFHKPDRTTVPREEFDQKLQTIFFIPERKRSLDCFRTIDRRGFAEVTI